MRFLRHLGLSLAPALRMASSGRGWWRLALTKSAHQAMPADRGPELADATEVTDRVRHSERPEGNFCPFTETVTSATELFSSGLVRHRLMNRLPLLFSTIASPRFPWLPSGGRSRTGSPAGGCHQRGSRCGCPWHRARCV